MSVCIYEAILGEIPVADLVIRWNCFPIIGCKMRNAYAYYTAGPEVAEAVLQRV